MAESRQADNSAIETPYLTETQVASYRHVSVKTLQRERLKGNGPVYVKAGHRVLYHLRDLEEWLQSRRKRSTSEYSS